MLRVLKGLAGGREGNAAVEFALILPVFLMLLLGMIDYGLAAREKSRLEAAARAGLQAVLQDNTDLDGAAFIAGEMAPDAEVDVDQRCECSNGSVVACDGTCPTGGVREWVTVTVSDTISLLVPWPGWEDPLSLDGKAEARVR